MTMLSDIQSKHVKKFILSHEDSDPVTLLLSKDKYPDIPMAEVVVQVKARKKAKQKLPEFYANAEIMYPSGVSLEQSSSQLSAIYKSSLCGGNTITDLTGGFGVDLYYMSKGFAQANYIEQNAELAELVKANFKVLACNHIKVHNQSAESYLELETEAADLYFVDPARRGGVNQKVFKLEDCSPNMTRLLPDLLQREAVVWIKLSPILDIKQALSELNNVTEVHVVAIKNEVKELLFKVVPNELVTPKIKAVNLIGEKATVFNFTFETEKEAASMSLPKTYLYEPNAAIMKAGAFNSVATQFQLSKLHPNSHLYTSEDLISGFAGRTFQILHMVPLNKKKIKMYLPQMKANITVRNCVMSVKEIRRKTGIADGGSKYLFATTLLDGQMKVLICDPIIVKE